MPTKQQKLTELGEGRRAKKYKDSEGYWTIGVGHLIDPRKGGGLPAFIEAELKRRDIDIWDDDDPMPNDLIDKLFEQDLVDHTEILIRLNPWVLGLDEVRQAVMVDMCFNLGPEPFDHDGFKDWPVFLGQVQTGQYAAAAKNMLSTKWARQVKSRAVRLADMMNRGEWPEEIA